MPDAARDVREPTRRGLFWFLVGGLTVASLAAVAAIGWSLVSLADSSLWGEEGVAVGRVGTFILLGGLLPALATGLSIWVGVAAARNRSAAPHVSTLAIFVLAAGAAQALLGVPQLQIIPTVFDEPRSLPLWVSELSSALGTVSALLAIGAVVQLSRIYGDPGEALGGWLWRLLASGWVWVLVPASFVASAILDDRLRDAALQHLAYTPFFAVLMLCGFRLWRAAAASDEDTKNRGIWLAHGALGFLLGAVVFRKAFEALGAPFLHVWALPSSLGTLFAVLAVAYAVFFKGAAGPNLILRRGSLYGLAGGAAVFLFAGLEELFTSWMAGIVGLPDALGSFAAAGIVTLVAWLSRNRLAGAGLLPRLRRAAQAREESESSPS